MNNRSRSQPLVPSSPVVATETAAAVPAAVAAATAEVATANSESCRRQVYQV